MMIRRWIIHIDLKFGKEKTINQQINLYNEKDNLFVSRGDGVGGGFCSDTFKYGKIFLVDVFK